MNDRLTSGLSTPPSFLSLTGNVHPMPGLTVLSAANAIQCQQTPFTGEVDNHCTSQSGIVRGGIGVVMCSHRSVTEERDRHDDGQFKCGVWAEGRAIVLVMPRYENVFVILLL